jgi:hypothetical protein
MEPIYTFRIRCDCDCYCGCWCNFFQWMRSRLWRYCWINEWEQSDFTGALIFVSCVDVCGGLICTEWTVRAGFVRLWATEELLAGEWVSKWVTSIYFPSWFNSYQLIALLPVRCCCCRCSDWLTGFVQSFLLLWDWPKVKVKWIKIGYVT